MNEEEECAADMIDMQNKKILILLTDHWGKEWFTDLLIPASRYKSYPKEKYLFMETGGGRSFQENVDELREKILTHKEDLLVVAITDVVMMLYSTVVESLKKDGEYAPTGANFHCFLLATNKLACRKLIPRASQLKCAAVTASMEYLPDLGVKGFFKPLEGVASEGVMVVPVGGKTKNPLFGMKTVRAESETLMNLTKDIKELQPYLDESIVGLVEEYIPLSERVSTVSIDGYIYNGKINHYIISDNVYQEENPEVFDSLVTPTQRLSKQQQELCWQLYDDVVSEFVSRGLDNQFIDVEAFFLKNGRLEVMEVNCRTYSNLMPGFARVYGENCMMSAAIDLLRGVDPKYTHVMENTDGRKCVTTYNKVLENVPDVVEFNEAGTSTWGAYYSPPDRSVSHVYCFGRETEKALRAQCDKLYENTKNF